MESYSLNEVSLTEIFRYLDVVIVNGTNLKELILKGDYDDRIFTQPDRFWSNTLKK